jgi:aspartyl-tRNA(Asn)/glutamyl-tRNA(Gln) amidotransferase subunit A
LCIEDVAALFEVIRGYDLRDAASADRQYDKIGLSGGVKGMTIGIPKEFYGDGVSSEVAAMVMNAAKELEKQGAMLKEVSIPSLAHAIPAYYTIASAQAASNMARFDGVRFGHRAAEYNSFDELYENSRGEGFGDEVKLRIMLGTYVLSAGNYERYYKNAILMQKKVTAEFDDVLRDCDILLTPSAPGTAYEIGSVADSAAMCAGDICTITVNIAGLPAISLPCGSVGGLPVGMQLIGRRFAEDTILRAGLEVQNR